MNHQSSMYFQGLNRRLVRIYNSKWPHLFSGMLLLLFAVSHFLMLTVPSPVQQSINTVFPFFTNHSVYLSAGAFELAVSVICLTFCGRTIVNFTILIFVVTMIWYRWTLFYTGGGKTCECLGILGRALHLNKAQEKVIPIAVLIILLLIILPWLVSRFRELFKFSKTTPSVVCYIAFILFLSTCHSSYGQQTIEITGQYDSYHYNPRKGTLYTNETRHVQFICTLSGNSWSIYATNIDTDPEMVGLRTPWEGLVYDGSNTYTLMPYHVEVNGQNWTVENDQGKGSSVRATISPGSIFLRDYDEYLDFYTIWLAYGLRPKDLPTGKNGIVEIPLPWYEAHNSPTPYGYEWKVTPSDDGKFISECEIISNTNLDLGDKGEMYRKEINPPQSLADRNHFMEKLQYRREIQNGSIQAIYRCIKFFQTNGVFLPMESELTIYDNTYTNSPLIQAKTKLTNVNFRNGLEKLLPPITSQTFVTDYRYRRANGDRVSPYVEYLLSPGDSWKSDRDQKLLHAADAFLQGSNDVDYHNDKHRRIFAWLLLVTILAPLVILLKTKKGNKQTK